MVYSGLSSSDFVQYEFDLIHAFADAAGVGDSDVSNSCTQSKLESRHTWPKIQSLLNHQWILNNHFEKQIEKKKF